MSSSVANSLSTSCQGAALSCQRYSACMASLRATARRADAGLMPLPRDISASSCERSWGPGPGRRREQLDHLERGLHRFPSLVHAIDVRALFGLRLRFGGEHAEDHRHARREAGIHQAARAFAGHVVEVRRVAADHAAQRDHRIHRATGGEHLGGQRQLEGAGHALDQQARGIAAVRAPGLGGAVDELIDQRGVETRRDDRRRGGCWRRRSGR